jgi:hypothetical protein
MMLYRVTVKRLLDGHYFARCESAPLGALERTGASEKEALDRVQAEIEFQLEYCPCTGAAREEVELEVVRRGGRVNGNGVPPARA